MDSSIWNFQSPDTPPPLVSPCGEIKVLSSGPVLVPSFCRRDSEEPSALSLTRAVLPLVRDWLQENFEQVPIDLDPRAVVSREHIYSLYVDLCSHMGLKVLPPSSVGKMVKATFPKIKIRRLGTKQGSKYHYAGLRMVAGAKPLSRRPSEKSDVPSNENSIPQSSGSFDLFFDTTSVSLSAHEAPNLQPQLQQQELQQHLCDFGLRLAQAASQRNFDDATKQISTFWSSLPAHISSRLSTAADEALRGHYAVSAECLVPRSLADTVDFSPEDLQRMYKFVAVAEEATARALERYPAFQKRELQTLRREFSEVVTRRCRINFLLGQIKTFLSSPDLILPMTEALTRLAATSTLNDTAARLNTLLSPLPPSGKTAAWLTLGDRIRVWIADVIERSPIFSQWKALPSEDALHKVLLEWQNQAMTVAFELYSQNPRGTAHAAVQLLLSWLWQLVYLGLADSPRQ